MQVVPAFILTVLIIIKLEEVRKRRRHLNIKTVSERADQIESALLAIVTLYLICELPVASLKFTSIIDIRIYRNVFVRITFFLIMLRLINAILNFILYCVMSS